MTQKAKPAEGHSQNITINFSLPEHKSSAVAAAWLAAVGTAISGLSAAKTAIYPQHPQPPTQPPEQITDSVHQNRDPHLYAPTMREFSTQAPAPPSLNVGIYIQGLAESEDSRRILVDEFRTQAVWAPATEGEKAISCLLDPDEDEAHRVAAALYLGGHGKREYVSPLKLIAQQNDLLGRTAEIALQMLREHPSPHAPLTFMPPTLDPGKK